MAGIAALACFTERPDSGLQIQIAVLALGALFGANVGERLSSRYGWGQRFSKGSAVHFTTAMAVGFMMWGIFAIGNGQTWPLVAWAVPAGILTAVGIAIAREGRENAS